MKDVLNKLTVYLLLASILCPKSWAAGERDCWDFDKPGGTCGGGGDKSGGGGSGHESGEHSGGGHDISGGGHGDLDHGRNHKSGSGRGLTLAEREQRKTDQYFDKDKLLPVSYALDAPTQILSLLSQTDEKGIPLTPSTPEELEKFKSILGNSANLPFYDSFMAPRIAKYNDEVSRARNRKYEDQEIEAWVKQKAVEQKEAQRIYEENLPRLRAEKAAEEARLKLEQDQKDQEYREKEKVRMAAYVADKAAEKAVADEKLRIATQAKREDAKKEFLARAAEEDRIYREKHSLKADAVAAMCFTGETPVNISNDTSRPIYSLRVGDLVETCDLESETPSCELRPVKNIIHHKANHLYDLSVDGKVIRATDSHPFYVVDRENWVEAKDLKVGYMFLTLSGEPVRLDAIREESGDFDVYNIETDKNHNYYASNVLVHNCTLGAAVAESGVFVAEGAAIGALGGVVLAAGAGNFLYERLKPFFHRLPGLETGSTTSNPQSLGDTSTQSNSPAQIDGSTQSLETVPVNISSLSPVQSAELPVNTLRATDPRHTLEKIYHRIDNPRTQTPEDVEKMRTSGQLWGKVPMGGTSPTVQAYEGPLPEGIDGFEFTTQVAPDKDSGSGQPGGQVRWSGEGEGMKAFESEGKDMVSIPIEIIKRILN